MGTSVKTQVRLRYGGRCHYCGEPATTVDHIVPRCDGGPTARWNLTPACAPCNRDKGRLRGVCTCYRCVAAERLFAGVTQPGRLRRRSA